MARKFPSCPREAAIHSFVDRPRASNVSGLLIGAVRKRKTSTIIKLVVTAVYLFLNASESLAQIKKPLDAMDQQRATRVLEKYLQLRKSDEPYKRYGLLSKRVKNVLKTESRVDNETRFKEMISDEASWGDSRIIAVKQVNDNQIRADVYCKVTTEYDPGGIVSQGRCEFTLSKEAADWRVDTLIIDGRKYLP
jgi:hypothetical protein